MPTPPSSRPPVKFGASLPSPKVKGEKAGIAAFLLAVYAIAVGITPEFDFLGMPKVRITDLLLPFILLGSGSSVRSSSKQKGMPMAGLFLGIMAWNVGSLVIWGAAEFRPGIFYLAKRFIYFLVAYVAYKSIRDINSWKRVIRIMVLASPLLAFSVLRELNSNIASGGILSTNEGMRASGIIANQQTSTALYIAVITCVALGAFNSFSDSLWKLGCLVSLATGTMAIFATGSRGGLGCVVLAVIITGLQRPRQIFPLAVLSLAVGVMAWVVTPTALQARIWSLFPETQATLETLTDDSKSIESGSSSIADRANNVRFAMAHWIPDAGIMGLGTGWKRLGAIDDFYIDEWLYHGLIGLGLFLYLQLAITVGCLRIARSTKDPVERGVASGAATAMVVLSFSGLHADTFYLIRPMEALALLLGLVAARKKLSE